MTKNEIAGLDLRYVLTWLLLDAGRVLSIGELVRLLSASGFAVAGRPSKTVSDALRWEVGRRRVVRRGRGRYGPGTMPRQTRSRICRRARQLRRDAVATRWDTTV